jgi:hypothetical protein
VLTRSGSPTTKTRAGKCSESIPKMGDIDISQPQLF